MTQNQLAYWNLVETKRSNYAKEQETERANRAKEAENTRSNVAKETETQRHNLKTEGQTDRTLTETERHNLAQEALTLSDQDLKMSIAQIQDATKRAELEELIRHNKVEEARKELAQQIENDLNIAKAFGEYSKAAYNTARTITEGVKGAASFIDAFIPG